MFDWVAFEMDCPKCCAPVRGFQTKDPGDKKYLELRVVLPWTISDFYSWCDRCDAHIWFVEGVMISPLYGPDSNYEESLPIAPDGIPEKWTPKK